MRHTKVEQVMRTVAARVRALDTDVILDFDCWARKERDDFRAGARALGANFKLHYVDVSLNELNRRLDARNRSAGGETSVFFVSGENLSQRAALFQTRARTS